MILVTGANGLLGSRICQYLVAAGIPVKALVRKNSTTTLLDAILNQITIVTGDVRHPEELQPYMTDIQTVIHCAAIVSFEAADKKKMMETNVTGTTNMVNLALRYDIPYFIHMSSVAALGRLEGVGEVNESNKWETSDLNSNYARSKYLSELEVWRGMEEGLQAVVLNPSVIIAPDDFNRSSGQLFKYIWEENKFYPQGLINLVDVRDVCAVVLACLKEQVTHERFIINANAISYKNLFDQIAHGLHKRPPSIKTSGMLNVIGLLYDSIKSFINGAKRTITKETIRLSNSEIYFNNEKVKEQFGFEFRSIEASIKWSCAKILEGH